MTEVHFGDGERFVRVKIKAATIAYQNNQVEKCGQLKKCVKVFKIDDFNELDEDLINNKSMVTVVELKDENDTIGVSGNGLNSMIL